MTTATSPARTTTIRGTIYTLGYAQPDAAAQLERLMSDPQVCLVDIRMPPRSRWYPQWNRAALAARYGRRYVWDRRLGNIHYRDREQGIALSEGHPDAIREAAALLCEGTSLILLCACKNPRECHRSLVARLIQDALPIPKHGEVRSCSKLHTGESDTGRLARPGHASTRNTTRLIGKKKKERLTNGK